MTVPQRLRLVFLFMLGVTLGAVLAVAPTPLHAQDPAVQPAAPTRPEVLRGRVTTDSGAALADAEVIATMAPDREVFRTRTGADGRWRIEVPNGTGDYLVYVAFPERRPFRKRVTRQGDEAEFVVDAALAANVQQLAAQRVEARRERPTRGTDPGGRVGSAERNADGVQGAVSPSEAGNLDAIAGTIPGITSTPGGISTLGLGADQNQTTLNGMAFPAGDVPRDARTRTRVATSTYDPSRGGASGARVDVELAPGNTFAQRRGRVNLDAPALQSVDPIARRLGERFTRADLSLGGEGELVENRYYYNAGAQLRRRSSDAATLFAGADALRAAGVASDSAARLFGILNGLGVPLSVSGLGEDRVQTDLSLIGRVDRTPFDPATGGPARNTFGLLGYAAYRKNEALGLSPTVTPGRGGERTAATGMVQGNFSHYFANEWLTDVRSALTVNEDRGTPWLRMPEGRALVTSEFADGTTGVATLGFGGDPFAGNGRSAWTWETTSETQFYAGSARTPHRWKLYAQSRFDGWAIQPAANTLGSFTFNSLDDVAQNRPSSFSRTLGLREIEGGSWMGALALGDFWRPGRSFWMIYGARLEANAYLGAPAFNPAVEQAFGVRNDETPSRVHLSPRLGFTWALPQRTNTRGPRGGGGGGPGQERQMVSPIASIVQTGPQRMVRGGIGEFRGLMPPTLMAEAMGSTGLADGTQRLLCIGSSVPVPDWGAYAANPATVPASCLGGAPGQADAAPSVSLVDADWNAPRSWRANLGYQSAWRRLDVTIEGVYSLNLDQPSVEDLNFAGSERFALANEGGRPVFVSPSAIVPATGVLSPVEARRSSGFGRVMNRTSDARSEARQLNLVVQPDLGLGRWFLRGAWTVQSVRARQRGFEGGTASDPRAFEWSRGDLDRRHQGQFQLGYSHPFFSLTSIAFVRSGLPYTPRILGDVNGDGSGANDRAFVFDPATANDAAVADGIRALLADAPQGARACLAGQLGRIAGRNSCEGPWTATWNAQLRLTPRALGGFRRAQVGLYFENLLGLADQIANGDDLRGWGAQPVPDATLLTVRGFDQATNRFRYDVNRRFGATDPRNTLVRAPFRVTLDVSLDLGKPIGQQQLDRWLKPGRSGKPGVKLNADSLKRRYVRNVPDPYEAIIRETDSLLVNKVQLDSLKAARARYRAKVDSAWTHLSTYLASLPDDFDGAEALRRQEATIDDVWEMSRLHLQAELPKVLNPVQLRMLPWPASMMYGAREPLRGIRVFIQGG